jgi:hypothetical protein
MNEPSSSPSPAQSTTLPLRSLQEILHNRIIQKKGEIHKSHNRAYNDKLSTEIETLQWVLAQILTLRRRGIQFQHKQQQQQNYLSNNK